MPTLNAYRMINITYGNAGNRIEDLTIEQEGLHSIVVIPNGCGKTYSITLLLQTIIPGSHLGGRTFEDSFSKIKGTAHIITAHDLDDTHSRLFTGFTVNSEGSLKYFNWCLETGTDMKIQDLPLVSDSICLSYDETREWLKSLPFERKTRTFNQGEVKKLGIHLNTYGIFRDEWEMMCRMNQNEGGIKEIFDSKSRKSTDDLLSEFVIPTLKRELKGVEEVDQVQSSFLKKIETLKMIPKWEEEIRRMDTYLSLYHTQLDKLKRLYDHEEDFRTGLYILKLLNEKTKETLNGFIEQSQILHLRIQAEKDGLFKFQKRQREIEYAFALYQLKQVDTLLSEINTTVEGYEKKAKELEDKQILNRALDELMRYNSEQARYEVIVKRLESRKEENRQLKQDMEILESKLHGYYSLTIQKKNNLFDANNELKEQAEIEKEEIIAKISAFKNDRNNKEKEVTILEKAEKAIETLGGFELYEISQLKLTENEHLLVENTEMIAQREEKLKENLERLKELEKEEFILKERLREETEKFHAFNRQRDRLSQLLKLFHLETPSSLLDQLVEDEDEIRTHILSTKTQLSKAEELVEYCQRFNTLPPNGEIRKLSTQLKNNGFQDFIPGYEYLREHNDAGNNLLEYGIICEDLKGLSSALKKIERPDWPVMVFSRTDKTLQLLSSEPGLIRSGNLMIETEFLSLTSGELNMADYVQKKELKIEGFKAKIQRQKEKQGELEMYRKVTEQFIEQYGIDLTGTQNTLKDRYTRANHLLTGCSDKIEALEILITEGEERVSELRKKNKNLDQENKRYMKLIKDFETVHRSCIHIADTLSEIPEKIEEAKKQLKMTTLDILDRETALTKQRAHLSRLSGKEKELTEEIAVLKEKKKRYRARPADNAIYNYANEAVESLEEKLRALKIRLDDTQLMDEEKRIKNQLTQIRKRTVQQGFTIERLQTIDRTTVPGYEECTHQLSLVRKNIEAIKESLGENKAKKTQLLTACETIDLTEDEKERIHPLNSEAFNHRFAINTKRLKNLEEIKRKNERENEQIRLRVHDFEILKVAQNTFLSNYTPPEKLRIRQLNPELFMMDEKDAWEKNKTEFIRIKQRLEADKATVESGWNNIRKATGSEQFEMNLSMAMVMEGEGGNVLFDYPKIRTLFEQDTTLIKNATKMLKTNIAKNKQEMDTLVENAYRSVECYINEFNNLSKFSKIETHGRRDRAVKFIFPELSREQKIENLQRYIGEILKQINQIEGDRIAVFVKKNFDVKRLIEEIHRKKIGLKVYKPSTTAGWHYEDWDNVIKWSGGEQFFAFFLLYASMSIWIRQKRTRTNKSRTTLIADNPFGQAISEHIFNPLLEFMTDNKIQFLTFTAIKDRETLALFPVKYSLILQKSRDKSILQMQPGFFIEDV